MRHSTSHILMQALERLYGAIPGVGPAIEEGFYHDFDAKHRVTEEDLPTIEKEMKKIIKENLKIKRKMMKIDEGIKFLRGKEYKYTLELAEDLKKKGEKEISFYEQGGFINMCRGPHMEKTGEINPETFKLTKVAGSYWKGSEKNKMIQRVYGVVFKTKKELDDYLKMAEEAEKRDHRKLGSELELFMISEEVGRGLPLWLPKGAFIRKKLEDYMYEKEFKAGYKLVYTPALTHKKLYEISGHLAHYKEDMYAPVDIEGEEYYLKPMNCPHHHMIYNHKLLSYRDLPLRLAEFGLIHRYERSGVLTGLIRARCFTQNDSHIYCQRKQLKSELVGVLKLCKEVYKDFGIKDFWFRLSLPDFANKEKFGDIENKEMWEEAAKSAREAMDEFGVRYVEGIGEATFYGPKIDVQVRNVSGKEDTIATAQIDFYSPGRFNLFFVNEKGGKEHAVIIHRAIMGSFDRFFAFLTEQTAGAFPLWLSPVQVKIISVGEAHVDHCRRLADEFKEHGIRAEVDDRDETVGNKIRKAVGEKIPYMLVIGDKEIESDKLAVRERGKKETKETSKEDFIREIREKAGRMG
ncbi:threonine--tRNA ligase [Candidatus Falkowbacteria bacterium]|nr:threonine--tRNA ligase [Candidatus Falkowbacteria bacterium]